MSETGVIGSVAGMEIPPVIRFVTGYQNGARSQNPDIETLNTYMTEFDDPAGGKRVAETQIHNGADILFGVGGNTGNAALLAAHEAGMLAIGVDVDQYYTFPDVAPSLLTSAMKNVDTAAYDAVMAFVQGNLEPGIRFSTVENGGIGLAPYHDVAGRVPESCQEAVETARQGLAEGTLSTGVGP
jgi:basic membrane protein A